MKKKFRNLICLFILLILPCSFVSAAKDPTVKCSYKIYYPEDTTYLTDVTVYFNPSNDEVTKVTYSNKKGVEKKLEVYGTTDYPGVNSGDYKNWSIAYNFYNYGEIFIENYNSNKTCPSIYVVPEVGTTFNITDNSYETSNLGYNKSTAEAYTKYVIDDSGNSWYEVKDQTIYDTETNECTYEFGTDYGLNTESLHFNVRMKLIKKNNKTIGKVSYDVEFSDPDNNYEKTEVKNITNNEWPNTIQINDGLSKVILHIDEVTFSSIIDSNNKCLAKDKIYAYRELNDYPGATFTMNITTNKKEAEDSGENIYDGDSSIDNNPDYGGNNDNTVDNCNTVPQVILDYINDALKLLRWVALALMIILGVLDFTKAVASDDQDALKKAWQHFTKRLIAVIILFLIPLLIELILTIADLNNNCSNF